MNPVSAFRPIGARSGIFVEAGRGYGWGDVKNYLDRSVERSFLTIGGAKAGNRFWVIADVRIALYNDKGDDVMMYVDASPFGFFGIAQRVRASAFATSEKQWVHDWRQDTVFTTRRKSHHNKTHGSHARPRGINIAFFLLLLKGFSTRIQNSLCDRPLFQCQSPKTS